MINRFIAFGIWIFGGWGFKRKNKIKLTKDEAIEELIDLTNHNYKTIKEAYRAGYLEGFKKSFKWMVISNIIIFLIFIFAFITLK